MPEASSLAPCVDCGGESRGASTTMAPSASPGETAQTLCRVTVRPATDARKVSTCVGRPAAANFAATHAAARRSAVEPATRPGKSPAIVFRAAAAAGPLKAVGWVERVTAWGGLSASNEAAARMTATIKATR